MAPAAKTRQRSSVPQTGTGLRRDLHIEFVRRWRLWFTISGVVFLVVIGSLIFRGLELSIEFTGGSSFTLTGVEVEVTDEELETAVLDAGAQQARAQIVRNGEVTGAMVVTDAIEPGSPTELAIRDALAGAASPQDMDITFVGPTWGELISRRMMEALVVFLVIAVVYMSLRLEFKMAVAALIALVHDVALAAGVYSLFGFTVSPATLIAFLTILGYSMYDTVVVFDRVKENTDSLGGPGRRSYGQAVNTAMNAVLWRSVNTTLSSTLPVAGLLFIGSGLLGAATLFDLALALFVGMLAGAYSSLFIAGPFLAWWKEKDPRLAELARHAEIREDRSDDGEVDESATSTATKSETATTATAVATSDDGPGVEDDDEPSKVEKARERREQRRAPTPGYVRGKGKKPRRKRR